MGGRRAIEKENIRGFGDDDTRCIDSQFTLYYE